MSTILKTLKKLEEEKSVLDQGVDLKRLVLQGESPSASMSGGNIRKVGLGAMLLLGGTLLGGALFLYLHPTEPAKQSSTKSAPSQSAALPESRDKTPKAFSGIPLSDIMEGKRSVSDDEKEIVEETIEAPAPIIAQAQVPATKNATLPPELEEMHSLIAPGPARSPAPAPSALRSGHIPGVKVKGIIFFGEGNPSNHIFVSTTDKSNLKMKAGDTLLGASLQSIQSNTAIFSFRNKQVGVGVGE